MYLHAININTSHRIPLFRLVILKSQLLCHFFKYLSSVIFILPISPCKQINIKNMYVEEKRKY